LPVSVRCRPPSRLRGSTVRGAFRAKEAVSLHRPARCATHRAATQPPRVVCCGNPRDWVSQGRAVSSKEVSLAEAKAIKGLRAVFGEVRAWCVCVGGGACVAGSCNAGVLAAGGRAAAFGEVSKRNRQKRSDRERPLVRCAGRAGAISAVGPLWGRCLLARSSTHASAAPSPRHSSRRAATRRDTTATPRHATRARRSTRTPCASWRSASLSRSCLRRQTQTTTSPAASSFAAAHTSRTRQRCARRASRLARVCVCGRAFGLCSVRARGRVCWLAAAVICARGGACKAPAWLHVVGQVCARVACAAQLIGVARAATTCTQLRLHTGAQP
jgi:hypothetical protein